MKKWIVHMFFIVLYWFTSSTLLHAWVMAHDMGGDHSVHQSDYIPCHESNNNSVEKTPVQEDCFETCMGVYDDCGWFISIVLNEYAEYSFTYFHSLLTQNSDILKKYFLTKNDPPPLTLMWYARVWKEIKKME